MSVSGSFKLLTAKNVYFKCVHSEGQGVKGEAKGNLKH